MLIEMGGRGLFASRWRPGLLDVVEYLFDETRLSNICDHPQGAAAERANTDIEFESALEPLSPGKAAPVV